MSRGWKMMMLASVFAVGATGNATQLNGHPTLTFDDLWYAGIEWNLTRQEQPFVTTLRLSHAVRTGKVQMTYHCLRCKQVSIDITTQEGKMLVPRIRLEGNVNIRTVELDIPRISVSALTFVIQSNANGNAEIQMIGF